MKPADRKPVDLKKLESTSALPAAFAAALRRTGADPWTSPFAASGGKPPPAAPPKRRA